VAGVVCPPLYFFNAQQTTPATLRRYIFINAPQAAPLNVCFYQEYQIEFHVVDYTPYI